MLNRHLHLLWAMSLLVLDGCTAPGTRRPEGKGEERAAGWGEAGRTRGLFGLEGEKLEEPLVTDRPDATESPDAVPARHAQLELGYTFTKDRSEKEHVFPETLLRLGIVKDLELRLGWDGVTFLESSSQGGGDMSVGAKYKFLEQKGLVPHLGVIAQLSLPAGSDRNTSGDVDPEALLAWAYDIGDRFALSGNLLAGAPRGEKGRFFQTGATVSVGFEITERLGCYVEYFGRYPVERGGGPEHNADAGLTFKINNDLQLDVRAGLGLNDRAPDFFAGAGISIRY